MNKSTTKVAIALLVLNELRGLIVVVMLVHAVGWQNLSSIFSRGLFVH